MSPKTSFSQRVLGLPIGRLVSMLRNNTAFNIRGMPMK
jgi:hypothetical protein